jgi:hypothetical protein
MDAIATRIRTRYAAMTPAELAEERAEQRYLQNQENADSDVLARAALRLDILDSI